MLTTIIIILVLAIGSFAAYKILRKENPELRIFKKHYSCSVCGSEYEQMLDFCPECAKERRTAVRLHEFFVEVKPA